MGYYPLKIGNAEITWETNVTTKLGFEAGLFKSKVNLKYLRVYLQVINLFTLT